MADELTIPFTLRRDQNGLRLVYNLGNELGDCPWACTFCNVGRSLKVTADWNIAEFDRQHAIHRGDIDGPYHPLIYNQGNVTNDLEFSFRSLNHVLTVLSADPLVTFVSLNSRERHAGPKFLQALVERQLPFPIHFILGVESFSSRAVTMLGKDTQGELARFIEKLKAFNDPRRFRQPPLGYNFGLDANLILLPDLYIEAGETRSSGQTKISEGFSSEVAQVLACMDESVPVEINIHPYHKVETLPFDDFDQSQLLTVVPRLQSLVEAYNEEHPARKTHIFVGVEGAGFEGLYPTGNDHILKDRIEEFNRSGRCGWT